MRKQFHLLIKLFITCAVLWILVLLFVQNGLPNFKGSDLIRHLQNVEVRKPGEQTLEQGIYKSQTLTEIKRPKKVDIVKISAISKGGVLQDVQISKAVSIEDGIKGGRNRTKPCRLLPDIMIIGFEKCGTMTLRSYLGTHPEIFISKSNLSIPYFNSYNYTSLEEFTKNKSCTPAGKLRLEKIATPGIAEKAYESVPDIKLLAVVREPVDRAMSHHVHRIAREKENSLAFDSVVKSVMDNGLFKASVLFRQSTYIDRLQQWIQTYGLDKIYILDGDNFIKNPAVELKNVEKFLGITPYFSEEHFEYNPIKKFYCIKIQGYNTCMNSDKGRPHQVMSNATRKRLQNYFRPFNEKLFRTTGRNFSWNY